MRQKDKQAWIRIVEAFLAILIVTIALISIISTQPSRKDISKEVYEKQRQILDIISKNNDLRVNILDGDDENNQEIIDFIQNLIPASWNYETGICDLNEICGSSNAPSDKEVYSTEIVITSTLTNYNPKKLNFFVWMKN